jgi:hypothetical protein
VGSVPVGEVHALLADDWRAMKMRVRLESVEAPQAYVLQAYIPGMKLADVQVRHHHIIIIIIIIVVVKNVVIIMPSIRIITTTKDNHSPPTPTPQVSVGHGGVLTVRGFRPPSVEELMSLRRQLPPHAPLQAYLQEGAGRYVPVTPTTQLKHHMLRDPAIPTPGTFASQEYSRNSPN